MLIFQVQDLDLGKMIRTNIENWYEFTFLDDKCKQKQNVIDSLRFAQIHVYATAIFTQSIPKVRQYAEERHACRGYAVKRFSVRSHMRHTYAAAAL